MHPCVDVVQVVAVGEHLRYAHVQPRHTGGPGAATHHEQQEEGEEAAPGHDTQRLKRQRPVAKEQLAGLEATEPVETTAPPTALPLGAAVVQDQQRGHAYQEIEVRANNTHP